MPPITITQLSNSIKYKLKINYIKWSDISDEVKLAAIASEDQSFPYHMGFNWKSIKMSMNNNINTKSKLPFGAGASTITQQTAKNVFLWQGSGIGRYLRKVPEAYFTLLGEWIWGKKRILEIYLNVIEMGPGIFGIQAAAKEYFHKSAKDLTREEAAMIVACLPNPKLFIVSPLSEVVRFRYQTIIKQIHQIESDPEIQQLIHF